MTLAALGNSEAAETGDADLVALPQLGEGAWVVFDYSDKAASETRARLREEADRLLSAAAGHGWSAERSRARRRSSRWPACTTSR